MNGKQRATLARVFKNPAPASIHWADIESLLRAVGCTVTEGSGSRVRFVMGDKFAGFHSPHPDKEAKRYQVRAARDFLQLLGYGPHGLAKTENDDERA